MQSDLKQQQDESKKPDKKSVLSELVDLSVDRNLVFQMEDKFIDWTYANQVKSEFLAIYPKIVDEIRPKYFTKFLEIMKKKDLTFNVNTMTERARSSLLKSLNCQFNKMWETQRLSYNVSQVAILKETWKYDKNPKWRPTGKSVAEQTLPIRCKMLEAKKNFVLEQWEQQKVKIQALIQVVETNRAHIKSLIARREELLFKMDVYSDKLDDIQKQSIAKQLEAYTSVLGND